VAVSDASSRSPGINGDFHPHRNWRSSNATVLADEIDNAPASITLLDVPESKRRDFGSSQPAPKKNSEDGAIAQTANRRDVRRAEQRLRLPLRQPISDANASRFDAFHARCAFGLRYNLK
jgi:hypothetical protein